MEEYKTLFSLSGILGIGATLSQVLRSLNKLKEKYKSYQLVKQFTPTQLIQYFNQEKKTNIQVFVSGELISQKPLASKFPLIWSQKIIYDLYNNNIKKLKKITSKGVTQISIADSKFQVDILRSTNFNCQASLTHIQDIFYPKRLSIFQRITNFILRTVNQARSEKIPFRGFSIGLLEREYGILAGDSYVIYGEIFFDKYLNKLFLQNPKHILRDKRQLLRFIETQIRYKNFQIIILLMAIFFLIYYFSKNFKKVIFKLIRHRQIYKLKKLRGLKHILINNFECQNCQQQPKNIIHLPCKHMVICQSCKQELNISKCPICKQKIEEFVEIYIT
ncbi:unnamed protein product [Paramecium primaurelia]|uniref:RING-type domain-containing protein n=1 Tax=Paramecium primaurelia TaxID=5886 RepID=A0A8S1PT65_PARPR|nr:unnamed protein product [Paramecium primaurelia]